MVKTNRGTEAVIPQNSTSKTHNIANNDNGKVNIANPNRTLLRDSVASGPPKSMTKTTLATGHMKSENVIAKLLSNSITLENRVHCASCGFVDGAQRLIENPFDDFVT